MKTAGIAIDPWKLEHFKSVLDREDIKYEVTEGETITTIKVETDNPAELLPFVQEANNRAKHARLN